jgi:uncharacterized protein
VRVAELLIGDGDGPGLVKRLGTGHGQRDGQQSAGRAECRRLPCYQVHRRPSPPSVDEPRNDAESQYTVTADMCSAPLFGASGAVREPIRRLGRCSCTRPRRFGRLRDVQELELLDWKRRVFALYADVRAAGDPETGWHAWREGRDLLFRGHPQSPIAPGGRETFGGLGYFDYDPAFRVLGELVPGDDQLRDVTASGGETVRFRRFGVVRFEVAGERRALSLYWLESYGGGVFLPFADRTGGDETYGGGRYLLDTVKGADLGEADGLIVLDFNFAYNPSCAYDPRWVCPLSPPENRLDAAVRAGEQH